MHDLCKPSPALLALTHMQALEVKAFVEGNSSSLLWVGSTYQMLWQPPGVVSAHVPAFCMSTAVSAASPGFHSRHN